jgi:hypothetical protein
MYVVMSNDLSTWDGIFLLNVALQNIKIAKYLHYQVFKMIGVFE